MSDALHSSVASAINLFARGMHDDAIRLLWSAGLEVDAEARDYDTVISALRRCYGQLGRNRELCTLSFYEQKPPEDPRVLHDASAVDAARIYRLVGNEVGAAKKFEQAGLLAHAAIARERAQEPHLARGLWARLAQKLAGGMGLQPELIAEGAYILGLVRFNVARNCGLGDRARREAIVAAVGALEDGASRFEALGLRERAFDCFNALSAIGEVSGTFEHVLEGRVNAIRILREDYLLTYALQQFDEAIGIAERAGEHAAAATFAREAFRYAKAAAHESEATSYACRAIALHAATARVLIERKGPPALAENALLSAIDLSAELGLLDTARSLYEEAAKIPGLTDERRARHDRAARRLSGAVDHGVREAQQAGRPPSSPLEVWLVDVLEWEQAGRSTEICAEILFDGRDKKGRDVALPMRRRALVGRLTALENERLESDKEEDPQLLEDICKRLGEIGDYRVLSALEVYATHPLAAVRSRAVEVAGVLPFKRGAQLLRKASADTDPSVVKAVSRAVLKKQTPVFVDPLRRLSRDAPTLDVRTAALRALSSIDVDEAVDVVLTALEAGSHAERAALVESMRRAKFPRQSRLVLAARERVARGMSPEATRDFEAAVLQGRP